MRGKNGLLDLCRAMVLTPFYRIHSFEGVTAIIFVASMSEYVRSSCCLILF